MRKVSLAETLVRWAELILSCRDQVAKTPDLGAFLDELDQRLKRARALEVERLRLKAEHQRVTKEIRSASEFDGQRLPGKNFLPEPLVGRCN